MDTTVVPNALNFDNSMEPILVEAYYKMPAARMDVPVYTVQATHNCSTKELFH